MEAAQTRRPHRSRVPADAVPLVPQRDGPPPKGHRVQDVVKLLDDEQRRALAGVVSGGELSLNRVVAAADYVAKMEAAKSVWHRFGHLVMPLPSGTGD